LKKTPTEIINPRGFGSGGGAANHPRRGGSTHLGAEVSSAAAAGVIYGSDDASIPMKDQERTCLFHWAQSLEKHTKADIRADLQHQHRHFCRQYKNAASSSESETRYLAIRAWWLSSGATSKEGLGRLELWLAFWHFHYRQWGGFMQLVSFLLFISLHVTLSTLLEFMALHFSI
jgi:hypothetical protein